MLKAEFVTSLIAESYSDGFRFLRIPLKQSIYPVPSRTVQKPRGKNRAALAGSLYKIRSIKLHSRACRVATGFCLEKEGSGVDGLL